MTSPPQSHEFPVQLLVRVVDDGDPTTYFSRDLSIAVPPAIGMKFEQGISVWLWEVDGGEESPAIERIVYDIDEGRAVCLFTVCKRLRSSFWAELTDPPQYHHAAGYFKHL